MPSYKLRTLLIPMGIAPSARSLPTRRLMSWSAEILTWSLIVTALALLLTMLALRVLEAGPCGRSIFAAASLAIFVRYARLLAPRAQRVVGGLRPRFGLRTLFLAVAISGMALAGLGNLIRDVHRQRQILDGAYSCGFRVTFDDDWITRWMYQRIGMNGAIALRALDYVLMERRTSPIRGEDFEALSGLRYKRLSLNYCLVTDDVLTYLRPFSGLQQFDAQGAGIGDKAVQHLAHFENVKDIDIRSTKVTDEGILHLRRLKNLQTLILIKTPITDRSVAHLKAMRQLRYLFIHGTAITPQGVAELRDALPECIVDDWSPVGYPPNPLD